MEMCKMKDEEMMDEKNRMVAASYERLFYHLLEDDREFGIIGRAMDVTRTSTCTVFGSVSLTAVLQRRAKRSALGWMQLSRIETTPCTWPF